MQVFQLRSRANERAVRVMPLERYSVVGGDAQHDLEMVPEVGLRQSYALQAAGMCCQCWVSWILFARPDLGPGQDFGHNPDGSQRASCVG
mmetsp:Transcript_25770/g.41654  ORF Transcript_25770/g.41654 Transcript_25770/m.41654 type:complete len:90 (+) Transcript_25770:1982-2251(+)